MQAYSEQLSFLVNALKQDKLSHSYIFSGTEHLAFARQFAKMILCKQEHTGCDSCSSCVKVNSDNHPDLMVVEPDGASIKNAQIEALQEFMVIKPFESEKKIAIVHLSHLMTESAQNRLLKVLEEPPAHAVLIFLTKHMEGLLETVKSRCQIVGFNGEMDVESSDAAYETLLNQAADFVLSLENRDVGRLLAFGVYAKQEKKHFPMFLSMVAVLLRDLMIYRETGNKELIHKENLTILETRGQLMKSSGQLSKKAMIDFILTIDQVEQKIKNNMNFDLTVDNLLFHFIEYEEGK